MNRKGGKGQALLSLMHLLQKIEGEVNYFGDGKWKLSRNSLIVDKGKKMGLYMSQAKVIKG